MRYIIVGLGNIGQKRKKILGSKCIATIDPNIENSDFNDYKDVNLESFDAAIISTPNLLKWKLLNYLIENRKHVLTEKPFPFSTNKFNEIQKLNVLSKKNDTIWYTSYNHRFEKSIIHLKNMIEKNMIGEIYFGNFLYGNGTVLNSLNSWRDSGLGVLEDLGSHLLDLTNYLFPDSNLNFKNQSSKNFELNSPDYYSFNESKMNFNYECSFLHWKNTFRIDIYGQLGSLHVEGLEKWGKSTFKHRKRVFPSGKPEEIIIEFDSNDNTWEEDIKFFENKILNLENSYKNDLNIEINLKKIYNE